MKEVGDNRKVALVAILGVSPAVLTEAVWALAHQDAPVVPDEILVLTTSMGLKNLNEQIQIDKKKGVWASLKHDLEADGASVEGKLNFRRVELFLGEDNKPTEDLPTEATNLRAADKMMKELRDYTDDEGWIVYGLLAGGRKTMSALFFSCMCLLGRRDDRIYHVLVSEGYENRLEPPFCYPQRGVVHCGKVRNPKMGRNNSPALVEVKLKSEDCRINLFSVPFAYMGEWCRQKCLGKRLSYSNLIGAVQESMDEALIPPIEIDMRGEGQILIGELTLRGNWVPLMACLCQGPQAIRVVVEKLWRLQGMLHEIYDDPRMYESVAMRGAAMVRHMSESRKTGVRDINQHWWADDFCQAGRYSVKKDKSMNQLISDLKSKYMNKDKYNLSTTLSKRYPCLCRQLFNGQISADRVKWIGLGDLHQKVVKIIFPDGLPSTTA